MVAIKPLRSKDHADWMRLWSGYLEFYTAGIDQETTDSTFQRLIDPDGDLRGAIARSEDGRALGFVHWLTHPSSWTIKAYCYLEDLYVDPDDRGGGIGAALIEQVRSWAEQEGCLKVYWLTAESNVAARSLYNRVSSRTGMIEYQITI
jgi:GNAT superfamily N-acetyltransferase